MGDDVTRELIREVSDLRGDVRALIARVDERLSQGASVMKDHEERMRVLEAASEQRRGMSAVGQVLLTVAGSSTTSAVVAWLVTRH